MIKKTNNLWFINYSDSWMKINNDISEEKATVLNLLVVESRRGNQQESKQATMQQNRQATKQATKQEIKQASNDATTQLS